MKKRVGVMLLLMWGMLSWAQESRFMYIQTSNRQPFFIQLENRIISSTEVGYVIVSGITRQELTLKLGFPGKDNREQVYEVQMGETDKGFEWKQLDNREWRLVDLQTMEVLKSLDDTKRMEKQRESNEFAEVLSEVSNNPDLTSAGPFGSPQVKPLQEVLKYLSVRERQTRRMLYLIPGEKGYDTVDLEITYEDVQELPVSAAVDTMVLQPKDQPATTDTAARVSALQPVMEIKEDNKEKRLEEDRRKWFTACKNEAGEEDFVQLRKRMAAAETEQKMIEVSEKAFKKKCYKTESIRNLAVLILQDDNRMRFFEVAYPAVTDKGNFILLQTMLTQPLNVERFKALIR